MAGRIPVLRSELALARLWPPEYKTAPVGVEGAAEDREPGIGRCQSLGSPQPSPTVWMCNPSPAPASFVGRIMGGRGTRKQATVYRPLTL